MTFLNIRQRRAVSLPELRFLYFLCSFNDKHKTAFSHKLSQQMFFVCYKCLLYLHDNMSYCELFSLSLISGNYNYRYLCANCAIVFLLSVCLSLCLCVSVSQNIEINY